MTDEPYLLREDNAGVTTLTLNRPKSRNSLSLGMLRAFRSALASVKADESVRVVIIAGAGPAFCAGHDLKELRAEQYGRAYTEDLFSECTSVMLAIVRLPKPVIARVHGVATAAGCQLVATADLAFAAEDARFATPGVNIGSVLLDADGGAFAERVAQACDADAAVRRPYRRGNGIAHRADQRGGSRV